MTKIIAIIITCILFAVQSVSLLAQTRRINITEIGGVYDYSPFYGRPVVSLISAIDVNYRVAYLLSDHRNVLQGVAFIYTYNDSMDVTLKVYVQDYKYVVPSGTDKYFVMSDFLKEDIYKAEAEQTVRMSEETEQLMLQLMEEIHTHNKEKINDK